MAEDGFKGILIGFILVSLFAVLILTAVNEQGALYGKDTTEITGGDLNLSGFNRSISKVSTDTSALSERFQKQNIFSAIGDIVLSGFFEIARDMISMITTPFTLISRVLTNVLHVPSFVTNVILGTLILSIIFAVWRLVKIGD